MGDVTAVMMDVITEKSGHSVTPMAVSVCTTPAAPSPLPIPYPVVASSVEGITDAALRTRVNGVPVATVGSVLKTCHGNEPGTLKEVVSLNTTGPVFVIMGAPIVICELGMMGITTSACISNKAVTVGANGTASGAGGASGGGGGAGGGGGGPGGPGGPSGPSNGGGGGGGSNTGAGGEGSSPGGRASGTDGPPGSSSGPGAQHQCQNGHPVDVVTGYVVDQGTDLDLPGKIPLKLQRFYSSARYGDRAATLGAGWVHTFDQRVFLAKEAIVFVDEQGRRIYFEQIPVGGTTFHRRERLTLERGGELDFRIHDHAKNLVSSFRPLVPGGVAALRAIADAWGNTIAFEYDEARLTRVLDTAGRAVKVRWRAGKLVRLEVEISGSIELWVDYEYSDTGNLSAVVDALGQTDEFEYDGYGRMSAAVVKGGTRFQYKYDGDSGRCIKTWGPNGLYSIELEYDDENRRTFVHGDEGRIIDWADLPGLARREALLDGTLLEEVAWDTDGFRIAIVNGASEGTKQWYDALGNEVRRIDAAGNVTTWEYDAAGLPVRRVTSDGLVTDFGYDDKRGLISVREPSGRHYQLAYDERGRVSRVQDQDGLVRAYEYDAQHNLIAETDARGGTVRFGYDPLGRPTSQSDPSGRRTTLLRDRVGRPIQIQYGDGSSLRRTFGPFGKVAREIDTDGAITEFQYGGMGVLARLVQPDGRAWTLMRTSRERVSKITNPLGESYGLSYDDAGRVIQESTFDGRVIKYRRGVSGRVEHVEYPDGSSRSFTYDRLGRVIEETASDESSLVFRRDVRGRVVEATLAEKDWRHTTHYERDALGRVLVERQGDRTLRYGYDAYDRCIERILFDGTATRYAFDRESGLVGLEHAGRKLGFERDAAGLEHRWGDERGTFSVANTFDPRGRLVEQRATAPTPSAEDVVNVLAQRQYRYDRGGRIERVDDARWGTTQYAYDNVGNLVQAIRGDLAEQFSYDPSGSLVQALETLGPRGRWKLEAGNRLSESSRSRYVYDKRGRRSSRRDKQTKAVTDYRWDVRDRLREVRLPDGTVVRMDYDAFGRRVSKRVRRTSAGRDVVTELVWDSDVVCAELSPDLGVRSFVHHPATFVPLVQCEKGEVFAVVTDHIGVPKELIDGSGRVAWAAAHRAWGQTAEERWDEAGERNRGYRVRSPFRLLGQYDDEDTGLAMTRYRAFDPEVGRWCSPDPMGFAGGRNLNGFDGAPTVIVDLLGLSGTSGGPPHTPSAATKVVETPETTRPTPVKPENATDEWDRFLGPPPHTDTHPRTGASDPNRIVSADGTRSIRMGPHETGGKPTKRHYHEETWTYDPSTDTMTVDNTIVRCPQTK